METGHNPEVNQWNHSHALSEVKGRSREYTWLREGSTQTQIIASSVVSEVEGY